MKWKPLTMPKEVVKETDTETPFYARFVFEPLERGFGTTIGNALRRVLLASIHGAAVTAVRIDGVLHEFSTLEGVYEDVTDIILNIKRLWVRLDADEPKTITLEADKAGKYSAADIETGPDVEIMNPDLHIVELTKDVKVKIEMEVDTGRGYVLAETNRNPEAPKGTIFVDSLFSPVVKVNYTVENTRVGQSTDYDRLIMDITTNGVILPEDALGYAAKILKDHVMPMIHIDEEIIEEEEEVEDEETTRIRQLLNTRVDELELSVRSSNCLRAANIQTLADLVRKTESEMLKYRNFGRKSLTELNSILDELGLSFGMDVEKYFENQKEK
ncbi:MAG TPA: DNA-directed RNA polymerase subunit alpha [candidate division Zixibacteria bacterium]|nr:DNA-directed RNA polymerase subunit alpha [candidate division Zixibacteria bacterium]